MVRVEVADPVRGVMPPGENEQLNVLGRPLQDSAICVFSVPDLMAAVTVTFPDSPVGSDSAVGDAVKAMIAGVGVGGEGGVTGVVTGQVGL